MEHILKSVEEYINSKPKKTWIPGHDTVQYAGPFFDAEEYVAALS